MKRLSVIILFSSISLFTRANNEEPIIDTLQWLKVNVEQKKHLFINKPFSVMLDSLKDLKSGIVEYMGPEWYTKGLNDTIWVKGIDLHFEELIGSVKDLMHREVFFSNKFTDTLNTHIKIIKVDFAWPVPFLRKWWSYDRNGFGSNIWNAKVEGLYKDQWVSDVKVEEY